MHVIKGERELRNTRFGKVRGTELTDIDTALGTHDRIALGTLLFSSTEMESRRVKWLVHP